MNDLDTFLTTLYVMVDDVCVQAPSVALARPSRTRAQTEPE